MKILGIHDGHNASAALLIDGKPVALMSEERFSYRKNDMGLPVQAIKECLKIAEISAKDLDRVVFSTKNLPLHYMRTKRELLFTNRDWLREQEEFWRPKLFENRVNSEYLASVASDPRFHEPQAYDFSEVPADLSPEENFRHLRRIRESTLKNIFDIASSKILELDHHSCHAHYAYFASPIRGKKTLVVTADGGGDGANATVSIAENDQLREISRNNCTDLARIYRYITLLLGMKMGEHEFKVMGLAPYCSEYELQRTFPVFKDIFHVPGHMIEYKNRPRDLFFHFRDALADKRFDGIAAAVQKMVEDVGVEWFQKAIDQFTPEAVVFSGGLSMNVKLNKHIAELPSVKDFYCAASGGDESISLGACYALHARNSSSSPKHIRDVYLGNRWNRKDILPYLKKLQSKGATIKEDANDDDVVELLAQKKVVGRFYGRMEFGARSLGNRSILADPSNREIIQKINHQIKFRDFWMPFAPSILKESAGEYLSNPKGLYSDHMTHTFDLTEEGKKSLVAAMHSADHTVRAHIVDADINPGYHALIKKFQAKTGLGALLNTSFNLHGYPIVAHPEHVVHVFENSKIDAVYVEGILVVRN